MPALIINWTSPSAGTAATTPTQAEPCELPIACMQEAIEATLTGTAVLYALTQTGDGFGGQADAYGAVGTANCRVTATGKMREYDFGNAVRSVPEFQVTLPTGTAIFGRYRIGSAGYLYEVMGTNAGQSVQLANRALCVRLDG